MGEYLARGIPEVDLRSREAGVCAQIAQDMGLSGEADARRAEFDHGLKGRPIKCQFQGRIDHASLQRLDLAALNWLSQPGLQDFFRLGLGQIEMGRDVEQGRFPQPTLEDRAAFIAIQLAYRTPGLKNRRRDGALPQGLQTTSSALLLQAPRRLSELWGATDGRTRRLSGRRGAATATGAPVGPDTAASGPGLSEPARTPGATRSPGGLILEEHYTTPGPR